MTHFLHSRLWKGICPVLIFQMIFIGIPRRMHACSSDPDPGCEGEECCEDGANTNRSASRSSSSSTSCSGCSGGNHVIQASGNLYFQLRPFVLKGIGVPIEPVFTYNSKGAKTAVSYGRGWVLNYDRRLKRLKGLSSGEDTKLECEDGSGGIYTYSINLDGDAYDARKRHHLRDSNLYADGDDFIEEFKDGTQCRFVMSGSSGYISTITDRHGNALTIERYADNRIKKITDTSERTVTFEYVNDKLSKIVLPSPGGGAPAPEYLFSCSGTLDSYTAPEGGLTEFTYDYEYRMTSRKHGGEEVRYTYGDSASRNAVTKRTRIIDGHTYEKTFTYDRATRKTTVVDEAGFTIVTNYNDYGDTIKSKIGNQVEIASSWGADAKPVLRTKSGGKLALTLHDDEGNVTYEQEKKPKQDGSYESGISHTYTHTQNNDLYTDTDSLRGTITYGYDANRNRTSKSQYVTDPDTEQQVQVSWGWTYYSNGLLHTETDPNGNVTTYEYDQYGNPIDIQRKDSQGVIVSETTAVFDALNRMTHKTERIDSQRWRITDYTYDKENRVLKTTYNEDANDYEENTYDCCSLISTRDRNGNTVDYDYYDSGKLWKETRTVDGTDYVTEYGYNGRDELASRKTYALSGEQQENVAETTYQYDAAGHKTQVRQKKDTSNWIQTDYVYNTKGQLESETRYLGTRSIVTSYQYNNAGRVSKVTKQIDSSTTAETEFEYDAAGRKTKQTNARDKETTYAYDELDRLIQVTEPLSRVTKYRYDGNGNRVKVINALNKTTTYTYNGLNKVASITQPVNEGQIETVTTSYTYDCLGNRTLMTDGKDNQTQYAYNLDGRLERVTDAEGHHTDYAYYPAGQLKTLTDAEEHVTHYAYNAAGKLTETKYAYQTGRERTESFTYDNVGNMLTKTLRSGEVISFEYDPLNRQTNKTYPDDSTVDYVYDDLGRMTLVTDSNGTVSYAYDDANRLLMITYPGDKIVRHEYNKIGSRTKLTYTDSSYIEYTYDDLERMDQVKDQNGNVLADYTNDVLRRTRLDYLNGTYVTYSYNDANWVTALYNTKENQGDISQFTYTHDKAGNRETMTTSAGTHTYTYDDIYQLTNVDYPTGYSYTDKTYNLDDVGNRTSVVNGGTVSYTNNELNEYTAVGGATYTSDLRGNLTSDGSQSYTYDLENRLTGVGQSISYAYDPFGKRIEKTISGSTTEYIHSGDQIIEEWEGGQTLSRKYVYGVGIDEPLVMITSGGEKYYYHFDALGSVRNITNASGLSVASYQYDVYGAFTLTGTSYGNPYTFTGRQWDSESGLYYYRARYYSPTVGRFLQKDPIISISHINQYIYSSNRPINKNDPHGTEDIWAECAIWYNYFVRHEDTIDLNDIGALDDVQSASVDAADEIIGQVFSRVEAAASDFECPDAGVKQISGTRSEDFDATDTFIALGNSVLSGDYNCDIKPNCCNRTYSASCSIHFRVRDRFEDVKDINNECPGMQELPGGVAFDLTADWYDTYSDSGEM